MEVAWTSAGTPRRRTCTGANCQGERGGWADYYAATRRRPPRPLLVRAAALRAGPGDALDLGAGAGNEARYLLGLGYRVPAVDADPAAVAALRALGEAQLQVVQSTLADFAFAADGYDLISA